MRSSTKLQDEVTLSRTNNKPVLYTISSLFSLLFALFSFHSSLVSRLSSLFFRFPFFLLSSPLLRSHPFALLIFLQRKSFVNKPQHGYTWNKKQEKVAWRFPKCAEGLIAMTPEGTLEALETVWVCFKPTNIIFCAFRFSCFLSPSELSRQPWKSNKNFRYTAIRNRRSHLCARSYTLNEQWAKLKPLGPPKLCIFKSIGSVPKPRQKQASNKHSKRNPS